MLSILCILFSFPKLCSIHCTVPHTQLSSVSQTIPCSQFHMIFIAFLCLAKILSIPARRHYLAGQELDDRDYMDHILGGGRLILYCYISTYYIEIRMLRLLLQDLLLLCHVFTSFHPHGHYFSSNSGTMANLVVGHTDLDVYD